MPVFSRVIEASEEKPYLCMLLKLEMPVVRELLSREEIHAPEAAPGSPAMATGETTRELLAACCRLIDLLETPQDIPFLSGLVQREIVYRILRGPVGARLRAIATLGDQSNRTAKAIAWIPDKLRQAADHHESPAISETTSVSQFTREYGRFFGQSPMGDVRALRV